MEEGFKYMGYINAPRRSAGRDFPFGALMRFGHVVDMRMSQPVSTTSVLLGLLIPTTATAPRRPFYY